MYHRPREQSCRRFSIYVKTHEFTITTLKAELNYVILLLNSAKTEFFQQISDCDTCYWSDRYGG